MHGFHRALRQLLTRDSFNKKSSQITAPNREVLEFLAHTKGRLWGVGVVQALRVLVVTLLQFLCRVCDIWPQFPPAFLTECVQGSG